MPEKWPEWTKKFGPYLDLCVSSLRRGHANLLCIVPILSDVPEGTNSIVLLEEKKVFLSWALPSLDDQKACINKSGTFNYEDKFRGHSVKSAASLKQDGELSKCGFSVNHARTLVGSGENTFDKGKNALQNWRHFGLSWAFVDSKTPVQTGSKFCVCVKQLFPWVMMPLQVLYVDDRRSTSKDGLASFSFGGGTLKGHLLAGEERFSLTMDENKQVWYEIASFSKPDHFLSLVGYPYVFLSQKLFAHQSSEAIRKYLSSN